MKDAILVRGAKQHNLKNVDVSIPRRAITVVTGPSGSGKSSLAFDTVYAEGQRRYVESLSAYARQFLERMEKPDVESVQGISPAVAIEQKNPSKSSRSTVGTATEVYDYLRLLWARVGRTYCPVCGRELTPDTVESVAQRIEAMEAGARLIVAFPLRASAKVRSAVIEENLRAQGFVRIALTSGEVLHLDDLAGRNIDLASESEVRVVVDRVISGRTERSRLTEAIGAAFRHGDGDCVLIHADGLGRVLRFSERFECPDDGSVAPRPTPQLFSFNNPRGACETCNGFGAVLEYDVKLIIPDGSRSLRDGAIDPWTKPRYDKKRDALRDFARTEGIPYDTPWKQLSGAQQELLLNKTGRGYKGIFPFLRDLEPKKYKQYIRIFLRQYQTAMECTTCRGRRLAPDALNVRIATLTIADAAAMTLDALSVWLRALPLTAQEREVASHILREAHDRVDFLCEVGLTYLTLSRPTRTLSGGEAQRIALANSLGSRLVDTLYVLDEPSIGLHARDLDRLLTIIRRLRDAGNTVLMVEHDLDAIRASDHMIEIGPGSGEHGGRVVFEGPVSRAGESPLTGKYLTGERSIPVPRSRRASGSRRLQLRGAAAHNLLDVDIDIPLGALTVFTGVSGSGKSTLVHDVLYRALEVELHGEHTARQHLGEQIGAYRSLRGAESLDSVVLVDQEPIGKSPRSNPVTYIKAYDEIRRIFAALPLARQRKYTASTFSFNVWGGRCERCEGAGYQVVEMVFMADVYVPCEECAGRRFKAEVLDVTLFGRHIHDVLQLTVDQAIRFFAQEDKLGQALWHLQQVGLGYLRLGQPATTLSGGEAQRVKIARELATSERGSSVRGTGHGASKGRGSGKLYIMDEPTTGLHLDDVRKLVAVLGRLIDAGHTVVLIEHNLDVIKLADWIVDLGPEGGSGGGRVVAMGRPEDIVRVPASHTGRHLAPLLSRVDPDDATESFAPVRPSTRAVRNAR